jgi:hypothetical protein
MIRVTLRLILAGMCLIALAGPAQPIGLAATPQIDPQACAPLPPPSGTIVNVSTVSQLENAVNSATSGTTILIANGTYNLDGVYLRIDVPNVTLRSASGNREAVILDGNYQTTEIIQVVASNVTIADLTLREAYYHPIHVMSSGDAADTLNTLIYNVHIIDPGEQAIKINPATAGYYTDNGMIACSHIELTDAGRPYIRNNCYTGGIDAHQSRGWIIRDNLIEGFWCSSGLSEHGIHLWRGCRDTTVERNVLKNNARGIGFGLTTDPGGRTYPDNPCPTASGYVDDYGGMIRNNFVYANSISLYNSEYGFDCGICVWNSCNARILHNTVYTADPAHTFSAIEWRFPNTTATLINNLVNGQMRERDGAHGTLSNNITTAQASWFVNASTGDLHLLPTASTAIDKVTAPTDVSDDIDGDPRPIGSASDIGADEYGTPAPSAVTDLRVTGIITASNVLTATLRWTAPANALTTTIRYSGTLIIATNWNNAPLLIDKLSGAANTFTATVPYNSGTIYFALESQNGTGWSALSNNAFWPQHIVYLPVLLN